jgi:uncharacterized membrane protein YphA (DoxX/SURF4 family)
VSGFRPLRTQPDTLLGIVRLARFDARGIAEFGDTTQAFLSSLAPLIAFPLVGAGLLLTRGGGLDALDEFMATLCTLLAPPVFSQLFAKAWRRDGDWLRYATAFNWCQWVVPVAAMLMLALAGVLIGLGLPNRIAAIAALGGVALYALALHWFVARAGLRLSILRAVVLVLVVNIGTAALVLIPVLLAWSPRES